MKQSYLELHAVNAFIDEQLYSGSKFIVPILKLNHYKRPTDKIPILERVAIEFGEISEPAETFRGLGFTVIFENTDGEGHGRHSYLAYRALSGLDPIVDTFGHTMKPVGHIFRASVLPSYRAVTKNGVAPGIWCLRHLKMNHWVTNKTASSYCALDASVPRSPYELRGLSV